MGYYIDLYFDKSVNASSKESIINEFCRFGLARTHPFDLEYRTADGKFCFALSVYDKREDEKYGFFIAEIRFSWATDPDLYQKSIEFLYEISEKMHFIINDGTHNILYDEKNLKSTSSKFKGTQKAILGLLGTVKKE